MVRPYLLLLVFLSLSSAIARDLDGIVVDASGRPVPNASVRADLPTAGLIRRTNTVADGTFHLSKVPSGRMALTIESEGFEPYVVIVEEDAGRVEVTLSLRTLSQQVTVTASSFIENLDDSPRAMTVLNRTELDRRLEFSVAESLREVPGLRITQTGGPGSLTNIRVRGLRAQDTAVIIDGMRFRDPAGTQGDASAFTADLLTLNVSRVEVMRGCGSSLYGSNAMGGVVNILSDSGGGSLRGDVLAEGGSLGFLRSQARVAGGLRNDRLTFSGGVGHLNVLEGIDGDDRARNSALQGTLQYRPWTNVLLTTRISASDTFLGLNSSPSLTANAPRTGAVRAIPLPAAELALRNQGLPFSLSAATVFPSANDPDNRRSSWFTSALFAADHQIGPQWNYRVAYQNNRTDRAFENGPGGTGFQPAIYELTTSGGQVDTLQGRVNFAGRRHQFSAGTEWEREALDNGGLTRAAALDSGYRTQVSQRTAAVFAENRWGLLNDRLQVTASGRYSHFNLSRPKATGDIPAYLRGAVPGPPDAWTGDLAMSYRAGSTRFRAHVGNAFRAPSLYERYGTGYFGDTFIPYGDPRLTPERAVGGDAGIDRYFGQVLQVSATYFYTELRSVIGFDFSGLINQTTDPFGRTSGYFSTAGGLARGVELEARAVLWTGFRISGAYTHTRTQERRQVAAGTLRTPRIFEHTFTFAASQTWRKLTFTGNFLGAPEFLGVISGRAVYWSGPKRLDATAGYRLFNGETIRPEIFVRAENLLNQSYYEDGFRMPGRWVVGGLRLWF